MSGELSKNFAYFAHNVASSPDGPRGNSDLSHVLADSPDNIILMCDVHHRIIDDHENAEKFDVEALREMKLESERRVDRLLAGLVGPAAHVLRMSATVGDNETAIPWRDCVEALAGGFTLADDRPIDVMLRGMEHKDSDPTYYSVEIANLRRAIDRHVRGRFEVEEMQHLAVFAFAPMPLLMELGRLLSDLRAVRVYARHREPSPSWAWPNDGLPLSFETTVGAADAEMVALKLCVSADISDERIARALPGRSISVWSIRADRLGTSVLRNEDDLSAFRQEVGRLLDAIRLRHGDDVDLSVFPAVPAACAVEFGRTWQPKAHPAFDIFDEVRDEGFARRHSIGKADQIR